MERNDHCIEVVKCLNSVRNLLERDSERVRAQLQAVIIYSSNMSKTQPGMNVQSQGELLNNSGVEGEIIFNYKVY